MSESATSSARGAEISERSTELVLPEAPSSSATEAQRERMVGVSESETTYGRDLQRALEASESATTPTRETASGSIPAEERGIALPGDRGRETPSAPKQRPSFWRRIALGRRGTKSQDRTPDEAQSMNPSTPSASASTSASTSRQNPLVRARSLTTRSGAVQPSTDSIEKRVVEPMLQALVSIESKLERSHIDLVGRSDQVEQRLTQLWDIEEQLGALGELQDSLLQVSEQQRRLEATMTAQNRMLRWVVGAVFASLALAAFVVAAVLR